MCAIGVIKRLYFQDATERFPSTSSVANADYRLAILQKWEDLEPEISNFAEALTTLTSLNKDKAQFSTPEPIRVLEENASTKAHDSGILSHDGDFFYPEFYTEKRMEEAGLKLNGSSRHRMSNAVRALKKLLKKSDEHNIPRPPAYYAILSMDGDKMGTTLSKHGIDEAKHREISQAMADFAQKAVPKIVGEKYAGAVVYAGGDDILALLPITSALEAADELRKKFKEVFLKIGIDCSASAGIVLLHQQNPLQKGVQSAHAGNKHAKKVLERNTIVIDQILRSGKPRRAGGKWERNDGEAISKMISAMQKRIAQRKISGKFVFELADEVIAFNQSSVEPFKAEMGRLLKRHYPEKKSPEFERTLTELHSWVDAEPHSLRPSHADGWLVDFTDWLMIARFIGEGGIEQ